MATDAYGVVNNATSQATANDFSGIIVGLALPLSAIFISGAAIVVSIILFHIGQKSLKVSEQVIISKQIWDGVGPLNNKLHEWIFGTPDFKELRFIMNPLRDDLNYFGFLIGSGVINEPNIIYYYSTEIFDIKKNVDEINKTYANVREWDVSKEILELIQYMEQERYLLKSRWSSWYRFLIALGQGLSRAQGLG